MAQIADSVSRAHGSSHLFASRRLTLRGQSKQSLLLRFRPRLRRGSFVLTLIRGSLQMGHPWPSAAQSASMPIAPRISARTQPSPTSRSAVSMLSRYKKHFSAAGSLDSQMTYLERAGAERVNDQLNNCANALSASSTAGNPANRASRSMPSMIGPSEAFCASGVAPPWASSASEITMA